MLCPGVPESDTPELELVREERQLEKINGVARRMAVRGDSFIARKLRVTGGLSRKWKEKINPARGNFPRTIHRQLWFKNPPLATAHPNIKILLKKFLA